MAGRRQEEMFDNSQDVKADNNSKAAGRDIIDNSTNFSLTMSRSRKESSIQKVLLEISDFETDVKYEKPDTKEYTIEEKIDYNRLVEYKECFEDYMDSYSIVMEKIRIMSSQKPAFENKLIKYIRNKYQHTIDIKADSDKILDIIIKEIEKELKEESELSLDDIAYTRDIVFYVFSRCKIFKKPPAKNEE